MTLQQQITMNKLKEFLEGNVKMLEHKLEYMEKNQPDHRNISYFVGQLVMVTKILKKLKELE